MVYGVQNPQEMYNKYGVNGFYNQYGLYNNQSPSLFGNGYGYNNGDDGKISFTEKAGSFFKGIGKSIWNGVKSLATPSGLLKTAATIGACMIPGVGPLIGLGLAGIGVVKGVSTVAKGASAAASATTDEQAKQAWENIGAGTFTTVASAVAVKGATKAIGNMNKAAASTGGVDVSKATSIYEKATGTVKNAGKTFSNSKLGTSVVNVGKAFKNGDGAMDKIKSAGKQAKTEIKTTYKDVKAKYTETKQASKAAGDAQKASDTIAKKQSRIDEINDYEIKTVDGKTVYKNSKGETLSVEDYSKLTTEKTTLQADIEKLGQSADDIAEATKTKSELTSNKNKFENSYERQADGSYKLKESAKDSGNPETLTADEMGEWSKGMDDAISEVKPTSGNSIQKAQSNLTKAEQAKSNFEAKYDTSKKVDIDGVESYMAKDGKSSISVKELDTLNTNLDTAKANLKTAKTSYTEAQNVTSIRENALKIKNEQIANAKKLTDPTARKEAIEAANTKFNKTIEDAVSETSSQAAKNALRGETSVTKSITGGFTRKTTANGWNMKDAGTLYISNQLKEANSEYEMYNEYLKSVANSNTGYSA